MWKERAKELLLRLYDIEAELLHQITSLEDAVVNDDEEAFIMLKEEISEKQ